MCVFLSEKIIAINIAHPNDSILFAQDFSPGGIVMAAMVERTITNPYKVKITETCLNWHVKL